MVAAWGAHKEQELVFGSKYLDINGKACGVAGWNQSNSGKQFQQGEV